MEDWIDIAGHSLGRPFSVIDVRNRSDLARAIEMARTSGRPLVAAGLRASYWHNLSCEGAIVADLCHYDKLIECHEDNGVITVQSGMTIRGLDQILRQRGYQLRMHPDSFGDTLVGSSFANGMTAGIGMMNGSFLEQVLGLEVMLATGETLQIGASRALGDRAGGISYGLPDLRSLLFGAEGTIGIISEMDLALVPAAWEAVLEWGLDESCLEEVFHFAQLWRRRGVIDTLRIVYDGSFTLTAFVSSCVDERELDERLVRVAESARWPERPSCKRHGEAYRAGQSPEYDAKWRGAPGETWRRAERQPFFGLDAIVPYAAAREAYRWARNIEVNGAAHVRIALYFGADGVNLGIHCVAPEHARDAARRILEARAPELLQFGAVPYRPGRTWSPIVLPQMDVGTRRLLRSVARTLDPECKLNAGVGVLGWPRPGAPADEID